MLLLWHVQMKLERMEETNDKYEAELFTMKAENSVLRARLDTELDHVTKANPELNLMQGMRSFRTLGVRAAPTP